MPCNPAFLNEPASAEQAFAADVPNVEVTGDHTALAAIDRARDWPCTGRSLALIQQLADPENRAPIHKMTRPLLEKVSKSDKFLPIFPESWTGQSRSR